MEKLVRKIIDEDIELFRRSLSTRIDEDIELFRKSISTRLRSLFRDGNQTTAPTNMKLKFMNKISEVILTGEEIKGEGDTHIEVALVDDHTGRVVDDGPGASVTVEIVLLKGEPDASRGDDCTIEEFNENIVPEVEGKQPLLAGDIPLKLQGGIGVVKNIRFRHHASKIKPSVFRLGARVIDARGGVRIKEAKTESFAVKDFRQKYYKKHETPSLSDQVHRLVNIRKGGKIYECLRHNKIYTVEDFLIRLLINHQELRNIVKLGEKKWAATVKNARACTGDSRVYWYMNLEQKKGVVFNVLGQVLGLYFNGHCSPTSMLPENHKADAQELLASAYKNWGSVRTFDDVKSLQQHLTCLSTYTEPPDSLWPDCPSGGHENTGGSEMIGESSSRRSNMSFHSSSSTMNSFRETSWEDFSSFSADDVGVEITNNAVVHSPLDFEAMFPDFDAFIQQNDGCNRQLHGLIDEPNAEEQSAAADATFVESRVVQTSNPPKRWKKLLCVSRWFSIRKKVSVDATRNRKKQKIG